MFMPDWISKKRQRDEDEDHSASGFSEHRMKRRVATLPHRTSPKVLSYGSAPFFGGYTPQPIPSTITPTDSDAEEPPVINRPGPFLFPDPSATSTGTPRSPCAASISHSHSTHMFNTTSSDDFEMADSIMPLAGSCDDTLSISGRVPTPIHSSFAPQIRAERAFRYSDPDFADDEAMVDRFRRGRNLPSPISEGEMSPTAITDGLSDMQMETMEEVERDAPTKRGHSRSKHSLRGGLGFGGEPNGHGAGVKKSFTMGYRTDCEKCRNKVPGHFSHIITN